MPEVAPVTSAVGIWTPYGTAPRLEPPDELALGLRRRGGPLAARRRVERDEVDVHQLAGEQLAQQVGPPGLVVDVLDQRVLDADPAMCDADVVPGGVEHFPYGPP